MKRQIFALILVTTLFSLGYHGFVFAQNPNGKDCVDEASCVLSCTWTIDGEGRYWCRKREPSTNAGNVCGDGDCSDHCVNDDNVECGILYVRLCSAADTSCTGATELGPSHMSGCVP